MADASNLTEIQKDVFGRARTLFDKAVTSGRSYVEVTRQTVEAEAQDLLGKVREYGNRGQEAVQSTLGGQLESAQKWEQELVTRAEDLLGQYGPELEKRIPAAHSAVEFAGQLLKNVDGRLQTLLGNAAAAAWSLPIDGYDELNVSQVNKALQGLDASELELVKEYETAHKNRKTVLKEVDQLLAS